MTNICKVSKSRITSNLSTFLRIRSGTVLTDLGQKRLYSRIQHIAVWSFSGEYCKTFLDMQFLRHYIIISKKATLASISMKEERNQNQDLDRKSYMNTENQLG